METLETFILNMKKKFLTFSYENKKITLRDFTMKSCSKAPSSKDLKDVIELMLQENHKSIQKLQDRH
jgi:hypothetical protein